MGMTSWLRANWDIFFLSAGSQPITKVAAVLHNQLHKFITRNSFFDLDAIRFALLHHNLVCNHKYMKQWCCSVPVCDILKWDDIVLINDMWFYCLNKTLPLKHFLFLFDLSQEVAIKLQALVATSHSIRKFIMFNCSFWELLLSHVYSLSLLLSILILSVISL